MMTPLNSRLSLLRFLLLETAPFRETELFGKLPPALTAGGVNAPAGLLDLKPAAAGSLIRTGSNSDPVFRSEATAVAAGCSLADVFSDFVFAGLLAARSFNGNSE